MLQLGFLAPHTDLRYMVYTPFANIKLKLALSLYCCLILACDKGGF